MITEHLAGSQLPSNKTEILKSDFKICQKDECEEPCISRGKFCEKHRIINKGKKCEYEGCVKRPLFSFQGEKVKFCGEHKEDGMINLNSKKCQFESCFLQPSYNFEGKKAIFCAEHKENGMIDVLNKKCEHINCGKKPYFNLEGETKGKFCLEHKENDMINVVVKKCEYEGCKKLSRYNYENKISTKFCIEHKKDGMIDVKADKCNYKGCNRSPVYNFEGNHKRKFCFEHKEVGMIDVKSKRCESEWCYTRASNKKYEGYCAYCFFNLYPNSPLVRNYKTKEKSVVEFVRETFEEYDWINDKIIDGGCSRKRPDLILDFGTHIIIIEIDENAHTDYDCNCENKRLMEISQDLDHRPIVFIRFNPDSYTDADVKKIKSCWSINKSSGLLYINNKRQWKYRLECLKEQIEYWIENETEKTIEIIELFYDQN